MTGLVWLDEYSLVSVGGNDGVIKVNSSFFLHVFSELFKNYTISR